MKKVMLTLSIVFMLTINISPVHAFAERITPLAVVEDPVSPASEETIWCTRIYNGMLQRRLWSVTYGVWLTEWEDVAYVG